VLTTLTSGPCEAERLADVVSGRAQRAV